MLLSFSDSSKQGDGMVLKDYGVLKYKLSNNHNDKYYQHKSGKSPYFRMRCEESTGNPYREVLTVQSQEALLELLFHADKKFNNKNLIALPGAMDIKFTLLKNIEEGQGLNTYSSYYGQSWSSIA